MENYNVVCKMAAILCPSQCVNLSVPGQNGQMFQMVFANLFFW